MATYDYSAGKSRVLEILENANETAEVSKIPGRDAFSFDNGYYGWITAIFIDIADSTKLVTGKESKQTVTAKILRAFASELIEILKRDGNLRDIGIRGDCVYAIYSCSKKDEDYEILDKAIYANTFLNMLNALLGKKGMPLIDAGIGLATSKGLVVKAGREMSGINDLVWLGPAVSFASHLGSLAGREGRPPIAMSPSFFYGVQEHAKEHYSDNWDDSWYKKWSDEAVGDYFCGDVIKTAFQEWINDGMPRKTQ